MTVDFDVEAYVAQMAALNGLDIRPEWRAGVIANVEAVKRAADLVMALELGDDAEPAPVFEAGA